MEPRDWLSSLDAGLRGLMPLDQRAAKRCRLAMSASSSRNINVGTDFQRKAQF